MTSELKPYAYAYIGKDGQPDGDRFGIHPLTEGDLKAGYSQIPLYTRAVPDVPELKTVGHLWEYPEYYRDVLGGYVYVKFITEDSPAHHVSPIEKVRNHDELVTRQNADEVIAAKDARIAELEAKLETANALVTCCCGSLVNDHDMGSGHSPVDQYHYAMVQLEADNKRLRKALEVMLVPYEGSDCRRDHHGYCQEHFLEEDCCVAKARAALGEEKP